MYVSHARFDADFKRRSSHQQTGKHAEGEYAYTVASKTNIQCVVI